MLSDVLNLIFKDKPSCQITDDGIKVVNNTSLDDNKMQQRKYILERCLEFLRLLAKYMHIIIIHINTYVTVHAKTSHLRTRIKIHFFTPACSYIH